MSLSDYLKRKDIEMPENTILLDIGKKGLYSQMKKSASYPFPEQSTDNNLTSDNLHNMPGQRR